MAVQILVWPIGFLSNAIAPTATMPGWLGTVAEWNPVSATASATRELFGNPGWGGVSWADQHALLLAVAWPLLILAVFFPLAVRRWQRLSRWMNARITPRPWPGRCGWRDGYARAPELGDGRQRLVGRLAQHGGLRRWPAGGSGPHLVEQAGPVGPAVLGPVLRGTVGVLASKVGQRGSTARGGLVLRHPDDPDQHQQRRRLHVARGHQPLTSIEPGG